MARRSRDHRQSIPGYDEHPSRTDRQIQHRRVRHAAHQMLTSMSDPDALDVLPEIRREGHHGEFEGDTEVERRRFRVWKTKFWKRRESYRDMRARMDAGWDDLTDPNEVW